MRTLGVVLLGYGRMGKAAHSALKEITGKFESEGIQVQVVAILDSDRRLIKSLKVAGGPEGRPGSGEWIHADTDQRHPAAGSRAGAERRVSGVRRDM